jgi:glycerophosphoryl diester phosphodiesterase
MIAVLGRLLLGISAAAGAGHAVPEPILLAHRGLMEHAPENTLPAFAAAIELGFSLELDVYQTSDGHLVVIHDQTVNRTTDGKGNVTQMTLAEVGTLDAGKRFHPCFAGSKVPTLEDVFRLVNHRERVRTIIALHVKKIPPGAEAKIVRLVEQYNLFDHLFAFDMSPESAARFKKASPRIKTCGSAGKREEMLKLLGAPAFDDVWIHFVPSAEDVKLCHARGKRVWLWDWAMPAGSKLWEYCNHAREAGVDGICTNHPLELRQLWRPKPEEK